MDHGDGLHPAYRDESNSGPEYRRSSDRYARRLIGGSSWTLDEADDAAKVGVAQHSSR